VTRDDAGNDTNKEIKMDKVKFTRFEILKELRSMGIKTGFLKKLDLEQLQNLANNTKWLESTYSNDPESMQKGKNARSTDDVDSENFNLTAFDKEILKNLLESSGRVSSRSISRKLDIPVTAIYRRRMRLENEFLEIVYSLKLDKLGWRNANLLISTSKGKGSSIGKMLLTHNSITVVNRSIGEHTIDLHAEIMFRNNTELLNLIEWIKSQDGVKDVVWSEPVEVVGKNIARPMEILDQLKTK
jgi:DNA-binding Lrp family transcriptional regulator